MSLPYKKLVAWQRADDLFVEIHTLTRTMLPGAEKYELSSQLRRAAYSVAANIVEGSQRLHAKESLHFLSIASASLAELGYGVHAAARLGYLLPIRAASLERQIRAVAAPLNGLMRRCRSGRLLDGSDSAPDPDSHEARSAESLERRSG